MTTVTAEVLVHAPLKLAYRAFTNSTSLREWLCDVATAQAHPRGRIYAWWRGDHYFAGHYLELEENKCVSFRWIPSEASGDPAPTDVTVTFEEKDGGVSVHLEHTLPDAESSQSMAASFRENWVEAFENLKSVLETGVDLRIAQRPMLGILPGDFTEEQASALGVPVREGLRLDGLVTGMGADRAGLQKDDVLVGMAEHPITNDFNTLPLAIAGKIGGDTIEVVFYRGPEKKTVAMELSKRPMPDVPFDAAELARQARAIYERALADLEHSFEGFSDEQAMRRPEPNEWSALEIVAHLILNERFNSVFLAGLMDGNDALYDSGGNNITEQGTAMVRANPSIRQMLDLLQRTVEEVLAYTALIPESFVANKASYWRYGFGLLQPNVHITAHVQQIKDTLAVAGK
jgi:uncharacterized protein YndB with AHSA1/START domain